MTEKPINIALANMAKQAAAAQPSTRLLAQTTLATYQPKLDFDHYAKLRPASSYLGPTAQTVVRAQTGSVQRSAAEAVRSMTKPLKLSEVLGLDRFKMFNVSSILLGTKPVGLGIKPIGMDIASMDLGLKGAAAQSFADRHSASYLLLDSHARQALAQSIPRTPSLIKTMDTTALFRVGLPDSRAIYDRLFKSVASDLARQHRLSVFDAFPPRPPMRELEAPLLDLPADLVERDELLDEEFAATRSWLETYVPAALSRLDGARAALLRGDSESLAQGILSCRRALEAVADVVFPPEQGETRTSITGEELKIEANAYGNRLSLYIENIAVGATQRRLVQAELELLIAHIDRVQATVGRLIRQLGKGVHDDVCEREARLGYLLTWFFIAEIAR
jgi:hypothetical protein